MKKSVAVIIVVALIILGAGAFALTRGGDEARPPENASPAPSASTSEPPAPTPPAASNPEDNMDDSTALIIYSDDGFSPASTTVKSGSNITVKNSSSRTLEFASDPHPAHTENRELNIDEISPGGTRTFKVTATGTWGFHNHLRAGDTGTLQVQ